MSETLRPPTPARRPVGRRKVLVGAAVLAAALAGIVVLAEILRHPLHPGAAAPPPGASADPRAEILCATPSAREGQERRTAPVVLEDVPRVTSNELYDCPQTYDSQVVRYRGELVGAVLQRDDGAWVFLNDDVYSGDLGPLPAHRDFRGGNAGVGVLIPLETVQQLTHVGGPGVTGDIVEVVGAFHRVDPSTREVAVIRATSARVVAQGTAFDDTPLLDRQIVAAILGALAAASVVAERVVARRR